MTVETWDPDAPVVNMTPSAIEHARRHIRREGSRGLRLSVRESGCNGYMYEVEYVREPAADDCCVAIDDDVQLFIDNPSLPVVRGTTIDYVTEGLNSFLRFRNPNATTLCGCGESFSVR